MRWHGALQHVDKFVDTPICPVATKTRVSQIGRLKGTGKVGKMAGSAVLLIQLSTTCCLVCAKTGLFKFLSAQNSTAQKKCQAPELQRGLHGLVPQLQGFLTGATLSDGLAILFLIEIGDAEPGVTHLIDSTAAEHNPLFRIRVDGIVCRVVKH